jgi:hypothetical protein
MIPSLAWQRRADSVLAGIAAPKTLTSAIDTARPTRPPSAANRQLLIEALVRR